MFDPAALFAGLSDDEADRLRDERGFVAALTAIEESPAFWNWRPRPDDPLRYDEQTAFVESRDPGVAFLVGGNGAGTSECACHKLARFVFRTPPPRPNTPFWVISDSYQQAMEALWVEKLHGHGHIPEWAVQWDKVSWYSSKDGWPFRVPLQPHPNGNNWTIEFKSYEQGRKHFQARAIGGFFFSEQFPWGLLQEVLRGCREYDFPGSKFAEFTPIDPNLSVELEDMLDRDALPPGWRVYRANTECAMEAGHVSKQWFDEFFAMVPEEMRLTRMTGVFATYEGAIYKAFNPEVHLLRSTDAPFSEHPPNVQYRRAIDWGAGPENAFAVLWAYRDSFGRWFVFDEYYSTDQESTTVDHLCAVQDRWRWPDRHPAYGTTYADPSNPDAIRIARRLGQYAKDRQTIGITPAANAVLEGIEHVQWLLKVDPTIPHPIYDFEPHPKTGQVGSPRLFICRDTCPNLARQMRTYRWKRSNEVGLNPTDAKREPLKKNDHAVDAARYLTFTEDRNQGWTLETIRREFDGRRYGVQRVG